YGCARAGARIALGRVLRRLPDEREAAVRQQREAVELCGPLVAQFPDRPFYRAELARSHYALGLALWTAARWAAAEAAYREPLAAAAPLDRTADRHRATVHNDWAWMLATCPDANVLDPRRAVELAEKAVELDPRPSYWNTLGAARYRADDFAGALTALDK